VSGDFSRFGGTVPDLRPSRTDLHPSLIRNRAWRPRHGTGRRMHSRMGNGQAILWSPCYPADWSTIVRPLTYQPASI
jgi:hypothetical protein